MPLSEGFKQYCRCKTIPTHPSRPLETESKKELVLTSTFILSRRIMHVIINGRCVIST